MPYTVEDSPEFDMPNGRKWQGSGRKYVNDQINKSHLSYLFKDEDREKGIYHDVFCFVKENRSIYLNARTSFIDGDWRKRIFNVFGSTSIEFLNKEFMRIGGYPAFYPAPSPLVDHEKTLLLLLAMRAFIDYGEIANSPKDRERGATVFVRQNIDKSGWIPNTPLSVEDIETILKRRQDIDAP